jgi:hypothetical protein
MFPNSTDPEMLEPVFRPTVAFCLRHLERRAKGGGLGLKDLGELANPETARYRRHLPHAAIFARRQKIVYRLQDGDDELGPGMT